MIYRIDGTDKRIRERSLGDNWERRANGLLVPPGTPPQKQPKKLLRGMDFFCGAGGFSLGIIQAGIQVVAALDNDEAATLTYAYNLGAHPMKFHYSDDAAMQRLEKYMERHIIQKTRHGDRVLTSGGGYRASANPDVPGVAHFFFGDIRKFTPEGIMADMGIQPGELDIIVGGPPCQGFSHAGKRHVMDPRNSLVFEFARFIVAMKPLYMVFENVPGIASMVTPEGLPVIDVFCQILEAGEYGTYEALKQSLTHGLPQTARAATGRRGRKAAAQPRQRQQQLALEL